MAVKMLTDDQKADILIRRQKGETLESLGYAYFVSPTTIARVMEEFGLQSERQQKAERNRALLQVLEKYQVDSPEQLEHIFHTPALTPQNVTRYLFRLPMEEFAKLSYEVSIHHIAQRAAVYQQQQQNDKETANAVNATVH